MHYIQYIQITCLVTDGTAVMGSEYLFSAACMGLRMFGCKVGGRNAIRLCCQSGEFSHFNPAEFRPIQTGLAHDRV